MCSYSTFINFCRLLNLKYPELSDSAGVTSSVAGEKRYKKMTVNGQVTNLKELLTIFGNREVQPWSIFSDAPDASEKTINLGERLLLMAHICNNPFISAY